MLTIDPDESTSFIIWRTIDQLVKIATNTIRSQVHLVVIAKKAIIIPYTGYPFLPPLFRSKNTFLFNNYFAL
jgi:hypothetical protein